MTFRTLIRRSLRFHWRAHLGVVLGAAIGSAALIGALVVGDSVRGSLRDQALERLGQIRFALTGGDRFFTDSLAEQLPCDLKDNWRLDENTYAYSIGGSSAALVLPGIATSQDGGARANQISLLGIRQQPDDERHNHYYEFWSYADWKEQPLLPRGDVLLNEPLAQQLNAAVGDEVIFRIHKPTALAGDASMSPRSEQSVSLRLRVAGIVPAKRLGNFSLHPTTTAPLNAFVNLQELQTAVQLTGRANLMVSGPMVEINRTDVSWLQTKASELANKSGMRMAAQFLGLDSSQRRERQPTNAIFDLQEALAEKAQLADYEAALHVATNAPYVELKSRRVFLDPPLISAASAATNDSQPILTYLGTLIRAGTNAAPYSMITAAGAPWTPAGLRDDEIVVNQWLADDLKVKPGDTIALSYFLPESGARLEEATNTFRVHSIVPMQMPWTDRTLMPDFPGIEKAESTSEWDAGFPLTYEIRKKDDDYWKQYRGTPKAFITLAAGQKLWGNRFGNLTAIRFPIPAMATNHQAALEEKILTNLKPEQLGLRFEPVREQALQAAAHSQDFGGLFFGFSFFLIIAALLLMAMLFQFGLEQRAPEIGTLLALGFAPKQVRKLLLCEGVALAFIGGVIGAVGGICFAKAMLRGLATIWRDAVGPTSLQFHVTCQTLVVGIFASVVVSTLTIWLALRKFVKRAPRELLVGEIGSEESQASSLKPKVIAVVGLVGALGLAGWTLAHGDTANAGAFFGAGALVLIAGLAFASAWLGRLSFRDSVTIASLAVRGCARRRKRSLATVAMLASGSFLIVSIGVFRLDANRDAMEKTSGTGGFALMGETALPVVQDLNSASGRDFFALNERDLEGVNIVPFRVRAGDEASCLNLNRAQKPRLLGVKPELLEGRFTFTKLVDRGFDERPWETLKGFYPKHDQPLATNEIAAIGDANSIQWAMGKKIGDTIDYVDERGQPFQVRIVGAVANSILQGQLLIDEAEFVKRFPGESGYRMFLMDAPSNAVSQVSATLSRAMQDVGLELTPTAARLNQFNTVQNTYLGTFQILGGLGLLLGSVGLGIVVLRNVLERRSELAVLLAVGFQKQQVQRLLLLENGALLIAGLAIGVLAAGVAVLPALLSPATQFPIGSLAITLGAILLNGGLWTWAATRFAVRGDLLAALRND